MKQQKKIDFTNGVALHKMLIKEDLLINIVAWKKVILFC